MEVFCGLLCFLAFPFPYSFSQHMVLIMCWKSRQAAGQTAMSPTESSKSSATSKVSATPRALPSSLRPARGGPSVGASPDTVWLSVTSRSAHLEGRPLLGLTDRTGNSTLATLVGTVIWPANITLRDTKVSALGTSSGKQVLFFFFPKGNSKTLFEVREVQVDSDVESTGLAHTPLRHGSLVH